MDEERLYRWDNHPRTVAKTLHDEKRRKMTMVYIMWPPLLECWEGGKIEGFLKFFFFRPKISHITFFFFFVFSSVDRVRLWHYNNTSLKLYIVTIYSYFRSDAIDDAWCVQKVKNRFDTETLLKRLLLFLNAA